MGLFRKTPPPPAVIKTRSNGLFDPTKSIAFQVCECGEAYDRRDSNSRSVVRCPTCGIANP